MSKALRIVGPAKGPLCGVGAPGYAPDVAGVSIREAAVDSRADLVSLLDRSFEGIYRWHARRTLFKVRWVRRADRDDAPIGLIMLTTLAPDLGYVYYVAVLPAERRAGMGARLLDDALDMLRAAGAKDVLACIRAENLPSIRLFRAKGFQRIGFRDLARARGFWSAARVWMRMVVAPGEGVFRAAIRE